MMNSQYPLGQQDFKALRKDGALYVDKTQFIPKLLRQRYYFLSRPRRFGKSLFLSTLYWFFKGEQQLFKGLAVDSFDWDWVEYPIIRFDLSNGDFSKAFGLEHRLNEILKRCSEEYSVNIEGETPRAKFNSIIWNLRKKFDREVVILVDEYEKPLLDSMHTGHFESYRSELADFYSVLKDNSPNIRFLFLTGITRFGHLNIFSGLNNLTDISINPEFSAICGITQKELIDNFDQGIEELAEYNNWGKEKTLQYLKNYYDGYHFSRKSEDIYNPYSILSCFAEKELRSMWIATGMTKSLFHLIRNRNWDLTQIDNIKVNASVLLGVEAEFLSPTTLFYQTGYLTIKGYDSESLEYTLGIPNQEVRQSLYEVIIPHYLGKDLELKQGKLSELAQLMRTGQAEDMMKWLQTFFSKVSYETKTRLREDKKQAEKDFQFVTYAIFSQVCDFNRLHLEYSNSAGRSDLVIETKNYIYIIEFKLGSTAQKALEQIEEKGYALPWQSSGKKVIKIGCTFSARSKGLLQFKISDQ